VSFLDVLWRIDEAEILIGSVVGFLAVMELAYRLGRRSHPAATTC
jgi:hypothetical protein